MTGTIELCVSSVIILSVRGHYHVVPDLRQQVDEATGEGWQLAELSHWDDSVLSDFQPRDTRRTDTEATAFHLHLSAWWS